MEILKSQLEAFYKKALYESHLVNHITIPSEEHIQTYIQNTIDKRNNIDYYFEPNKYLMTFQKINIITYIVDLFVDNEYRLQGLGKELIQQLKEPLFLKCYNTNPAMFFFQKIGFKELPIYTNNNYKWLYKADYIFVELLSVMAYQMELLQG